MNQILWLLVLAPPAPSQNAGLMNNGRQDNNIGGGDVQKLQQQLQDIKDQVSRQVGKYLFFNRQII